jgi:transcriptional regulator of acetoin/glycerol metabolism
MVERLLLLADGAVDAALVRLALPAGDGEAQVMAPVQSGSLAERTDAFEREQILAELKRHHQRMTDTARALGLERSHLYKKCPGRWGLICGRCGAGGLKCFAWSSRRNGWSVGDGEVDSRY